jgi:hypothetical protein
MKTNAKSGIVSGDAAKIAAAQTIVGRRSGPAMRKQTIANAMIASAPARADINASASASVSGRFAAGATPLTAANITRPRAM